MLLHDLPRRGGGGGSHDRAAHDRDVTRQAEMVAASEIQQVLGTNRLSRCTLYFDVELCGMCSYCIRETRIRKWSTRSARPSWADVRNGRCFRAEKSPTSSRRFSAATGDRRRGDAGGGRSGVAELTSADPENRQVPWLLGRRHPQASGRPAIAGAQPREAVETAGAALSLTSALSSATQSAADSPQEPVL